MTSRRPKAETAANAPDQSLPHDQDRGSSQPYAAETEAYQGGVASPPEQNPSHPPPLDCEKGKAAAPKK